MYSYSLSLDTSPEALGRTNSNSDAYYNGAAAGEDGGGGIDFRKLLELRTRPIPIPIAPIRTTLDERSLSEIISSGLASPRPPRTLESVKSSECLEGLLSPSIRSTAGTPRDHPSFEPHPMIADAWEALRRSLVYFRAKPVGTIAAMDPTEESLNYNQVFVRDFVPSALAFLMNGEPDIVKNFLLKTLRLQSIEKRIDCFTLGEGVMPASFKVKTSFNHSPLCNFRSPVGQTMIICNSQYHCILI
jgi:hypothetical protein